MSLSCWAFTAGSDNTQHIPLNLSANLQPNQGNPRITLSLPLEFRWAVTHTHFTGEAGAMEMPRCWAKGWRQSIRGGGSCLVMGFQTNTGEHADKLKLFVVSKVVIIVQCFASQKWPRCVQTSSSMSNSGMHINRQEMDTWDAQKYKSFKQKHRSWAYYTKLQTFKQHAKTYKLYGRQWVQTQRNTVVFTVTDNFSSPWTFWC